MQSTTTAFAGLVGRCEAMEALKARILRIAPSELRVHVCGETGTGKENVARALHDLSPRARRPFVAVNVAGFSDELFAAELFGHARGAFTGAVAARDGYVAEAEGGHALHRRGRGDVAARAGASAALPAGAGVPAARRDDLPARRRAGA